MISSSHPAFAKLGPKLERIRRELSHLELFLERFGSLEQEPVGLWGRTTAAGAAISSAYNGIEDILANIARDVDGRVPAGDTWHQDLLDQMLAALDGRRPALLTSELHGLLTELKGFRHRIRHNYGFDLDPARTAENLARIRQAFPMLVDALASLEQAVTAELRAEGRPSLEARPGQAG